MNDEKLLEALKASSDDIKVPPELEPSSIEEKLTGRKPSRKIYPYGLLAGAACAALVSFAVWNNNSSQITPDSLRSNDAASEEISIGSSGSADRSSTPDYDESEIAQADSYDEIYDILSDIMGTNEIVWDEAEVDIEWEEATVDDAAADSSSAKEFSGSSEDSGAAADMDMGASDAALSSGSVESADMAVDDADTVSVAGEDFSTTNLRELGVDEADILKTDGSYIYALNAQNAIRIIQADKGKLKLIHIFTLDNLDDTVREFYVDGDHLSVVTDTYENTMRQADDGAYYNDFRSYIRLSTYDISDKTKPVLSGEITQDGHYHSSRKSGDYIYLFTNYYPTIERKTVQESFIPSVNESLLRLDDIYLPSPDYQVYSMYTTISSVSLQNPGEVIDSKAVLSGSDILYVSGQNIYMTGYNWEASQTEIMKFHYEDGKITPIGAALVKGTLLDSFCLDEHNGYLRMVTTSYDSVTTNSLLILDEKLNLVSRIDNLAPDEEIKSARFMGDAGYFVTFQNIDPLFSVDLSDPESPEILGELKITGFSQYLHPYGENLLLGIGWEVDPDTLETQGLKLSMFDTSDPADVQEIDKYVLKDISYMPGLYDYKSILANADKNIIGFAAEEYTYAKNSRQYEDYSSYVWTMKYFLFHYDENDGFVLDHHTEDSYSEDDYYYSEFGLRGMYIGDVFYLLSDHTVESFDLKDFEPIDQLNTK